MTFDCLSFDGFDSYLLLGLLVIAFVDVSELPRPYFFFQNVIIYYFWHLYVYPFKNYINLNNFNSMYIISINMNINDEK